MVNATIGTQEFLAFQGNLSPPQHIFLGIDEPWETGAGYARLGRKGAVEQILTWSEFDTALDAQQELRNYEGLMNSVVDIELNVGGQTLIYPYYKILGVRDVTDFPYTPTSGGGKHFRLIVQWTLQQVTGEWGT